MAAYNTITLDVRCPSCGRQAGVHAQTHVASSYDGDETGRFHGRTYRIGEAMRWWPRDRPAFADWRVNGRLDGALAEDEDEEACYATCQSCGAQLYAILRFRENVPIAVVGIGLEADWPAGYLR